MQAIVIPISDRHIGYADTVASRLTTKGIRVEVYDKSERMNAKIRDAQIQKIPYMLVVGDKEADADAAAVRLRDGTDLGAIPIQQIEDRMLSEITCRT